MTVHTDFNIRTSWENLILFKETLVLHSAVQGPVLCYIETFFHVAKNMFQNLYQNSFKMDQSWDQNCSPHSVKKMLTFLSMRCAFKILNYGTFVFIAEEYKSQVYLQKVKDRVWQISNLPPNVRNSSPRSGAQPPLPSWWSAWWRQWWWWPSWWK